MDLYVPQNVKAETEVISGFGKEEIRDALSILLTGLVIVGALILFGFGVMTVILTATGFGGFAFLFCRRSYDSMSVFQWIRVIRKFYTEQQIYPYRYLDEWGIDENTKK